MGRRSVKWALTRKRTLWGGALEHGDLRLLEDGSERSGALSLYGVAFETASEGGRSGMVSGSACQWALTVKHTLGCGGGALQ